MKCDHLSPVSHASSLSTTAAGVLPLPTLQCPHNSLKAAQAWRYTYVYSMTSRGTRPSDLPSASNNLPKKPLKLGYVLPAWLPSSWTWEQEAYNHLIQLPRCPPLSRSPPRPHVLSNLPTPETSVTSSEGLPCPGPDQLQWPLCCPSQPLLVWSLHNCQKKLLRSHASPPADPLQVPHCFSERTQISNAPEEACSGWLSPHPVLRAPATDCQAPFLLPFLLRVFTYAPLWSVLASFMST